MVLPLSLALALSLRYRSGQVLYGFSFVLIAGGVLASGSRGALLGTMAAVVIVVAIRFRGIRNFVWLGIVAGLATAWTASFGLLPSGPIERVMTAVGVGGVSFGHVTDANFSAVERAAHWLAGVRMFAAHPILGVGIGNYAAAYPAYHPRGWYASLEHAHNYYINISAEAGIFGLSSYLLVAGSALWYSYASIRLALDRVHYAVGLGVLGALVATNVHNLFDVLYVHGLAALLGLLVALVAVSLRDGAGESFRRGTS